MDAAARLLGRVDGLAHQTYLAIEAMSNSGLKKIRRTPLHYHAPERPGKAPTPAMFAGTLAHCALLEPTEFERRYNWRDWPRDRDGELVGRNTNAFKAWAAILKAAGAEPITELQRDTAFGQAESLLKLPDIAKLFEYDGANEVSLFWVDRESGTYCKARPDRVANTTRGAILLDMKTTSDAGRDAFMRTAGSLYYHVQAAFYVRAWLAAGHSDCLGLVFGVVESEFPYAAACFMYDDESLGVADTEIDRLLLLHAQCEKKGEWPGHPPEMQLLTLPPWMAYVNA